MRGWARSLYPPAAGETTPPVPIGGDEGCCRSPAFPGTLFMHEARRADRILSRYNAFSARYSWGGEDWQVIELKDGIWGTGCGEGEVFA